MKQDILFSVIVPTLNEEDYLPKLLLDFSKQIQKNFEVIVVDGNSEDNTEKEALKFGKYFPLTFCKVKKRNVSFQRNYGAEKAGGGFLVFLDADSRIETTFSSNLKRHVVGEKDLLFLPTLMPDDHSRKNKILFKLINYIIELSQSLNKPFSSGGAIFISRKLFFKISGFNAKLYLCEDHDLIQKARKQGVKAEVLKDVKVVFSLRRLKKEGQIPVLYKYTLASVYALINGEITNRIFNYEMGGKRYKNLSLSKDRSGYTRNGARFYELIRTTSRLLGNPRL